MRPTCPSPEAALIAREEARRRQAARRRPSDKAERCAVEQAVVAYETAHGAHAAGALAAALAGDCFARAHPKAKVRAAAEALFRRVRASP